MSNPNHDGTFGGMSPQEAAAKSHESRRRRKEMDLDDRMKSIFVEATDAAARDLVKAARGTGDFEKLPPEKRLDAIKTVLAYGYSPPPRSGAARPPGNAEPTEEEPKEEPPLV